MQVVLFMSKPFEKFVDEGQSVYDFGDKFLVKCPKCKRLAEVVSDESEKHERFWQNPKLSCLNCGFNKHKKGVKCIGGNFDWYFQQPLWLQINCCGETLWAYNEKHLEFIENYVSAKLRSRIPNQNRSLASRLPNWLKRAKNRDEILKAIDKLREKLNGTY